MTDPADLAAALSTIAALPAAEATDTARADQHRRWAGGQRVPAEAYLTALPAVSADPEHALVLIYGEVVSRAALGEAVELGEFQARFPHLADRLVVQFALHDALAAADPGTQTVDHETGVTAPAHDAADPPRQIAQYRVLAELGRGGMGVVYRAEDLRLGRAVALKVIRPAAGAATTGWVGRGTADARERFLREARAAAAVKHDHIVTVYHADEDAGVPFLAMELLDGESLDRRLEAGPIPPFAETVRIVRQTAEALAAAHAKGLVHRDVKPSNVWLEAPTGRVKVLDFGLARAVSLPAEPLPADGSEPPAGLTGTRAVVGTPGYIAPEQARGEAVDARADLFSLGCVLFRMTTGRPAFAGTSARQLLAAVQTDIPPPVRDANAAVPPALAALTDRLLKKDASARPASAAGVAEELRRIEASLASPPAMWTRRAAVGALVASAGGVAAWRAFKRPATSDTGVTTDTPPPSLDHLDPAAIPAAERFEGQPKELVAVIGTHADKHWGPVTAMTFGAGGWLATGGADGVVKVFDAATLAERSWFQAHRVQCEAAAAATGGALLATSDGFSETRVTDVSGTPRLIHALPGVPGRSLAFSPDGALLAVAHPDVGVSVIELSGAKPRVRINASKTRHKGGVHGVGFGPGGKHFLTAGADGAVGVWDATTGTEVRFVPGEHATPARLAASADGAVVVSVEQAGPIRVWGADGVTRRIAFRNPVAHEPPVVTLSADGTRFAIVTPGTVRVWDLRAAADDPSVTFGAMTGFAGCLSPDGKRIALAYPAFPSFNVYDATRTDPPMEKAFAPDASFTPLALTARGQLLTHSDKVRWCDLSGDRPRTGDRAAFATRVDVRVGQFFTTRHGRLFYAEDWLHEFDVTGDAARLVRRADIDPTVLHITTTPDGAVVATADRTGSVNFWTAAEDGWRLTGTLRPGGAGPLALSADGAKLVAGQLEVWDRTSDPPVAVGLGDVPRTFLWAVSPDGRRLAALSGDVLRVWDLMRPGVPLVNSMVVPADSSSLNHLRFSPDGRSVLVAAAAAGEYALRVWDLETQRATHTVPYPRGARDVFFAADGRHVLVSNSNRTVYVLRLGKGPAP